MSSTADFTETKETTESQDSKRPKEIPLPLYQYKELEKPDALRLLRIRPASDAQEDIDCEIIEISLLKDGESSGDTEDDHPDDKAKHVNGSSGPPETANLSSLLGVLEEYDSDDEEKPPSRDGSDDVQEEEPPNEAAEAKELSKKKRSYEAMSWCWGREPADQILRVHEGDKVSAFLISKNLRSALWALRKSNEVRQLWIDAICINQSDTKERNQQVPRMDKIYGGAGNVCIWLGEASDDSKLAMDFIRERVLELWKFDQLIENRKLAKHWAALIRLMKRPWFSRRWVVQEIALSPRGGTIYCGKDQNSWQDFADAVSLFVEVESATHRLSDVMRLDSSFWNIPDFFGDVSSLGAALLVDATSNLFRRGVTGERMPLSSLEYLVSRLSVFEATQPRDTIYALLAISKETTPKNEDFDTPIQQSQAEKNVLAALVKKGGFANKGYNVNYRLPVIDVYKEFIEFSLRNGKDKKRSLDIICRPWAPLVKKSHDDPTFLNPVSDKDKKSEKEKDKSKKRPKAPEHKKSSVSANKSEEGVDQEIPLPSWIPSMSGAAFEMEEHPTAGLRMERQNANSLVGLPDESGRRNYTAAGDVELDLKKLEFRKWNTLRKPNSSYPEHSMFTRGFILDEVGTVEHLAANGNIPYRWLQVGGWFDTNKNPPEEFWRTLVADRGEKEKNPPTYFPRACKESMRFKAKTMSKTGGYLDCRKMINEGRCTIVAQFLRRVQEVIWNRQLMRTTGGRLGLIRDDVIPGFKVAILYGCSVPVILQEIKKSPAELKAELIDRYNQWYDKVKMVVAFSEVRYKLVKARREQKARARELEENPHPSAGRRRGKGTWPVYRGESSHSDKASEPLERRKSSLKAVKEAASEANGIGEEAASQSGELIPCNGAQTTEKGSDGEDVDNAIDAHDDEHGANGMPHKRKSIGDQENGHKRPKHDGTKKRELRRPLTEEERQTELAKGEKLFEVGKRTQKEKVAQEVLKHLSYYRLVGECYVHGMMNGEAIKLQNDTNIPAQLFELR